MLNNGGIVASNRLVEEYETHQEYNVVLQEVVGHARMQPHEVRNDYNHGRPNCFI